MQRRIIAGVLASFVMTTLVVIGTALPAHALNRCGLAYSYKTDPPFTFYFDETPPIQPYRVRMKPSTPRDVCVEFMTVRPGWETKGHIIRFYDYQGVAASKICGEAKVCRWHSDDDKFFFKVTAYARPKNQGAEWTLYTGEKVIVIAE